VDHLQQLADAIQKEIRASSDFVCYLNLRYLAETVAESYRSIPAVRAHLTACGIRAGAELERWNKIFTERGFYPAAVFLCTDGKTPGIAVRKKVSGVFQDERLKSILFEAKNKYETWVARAINEEFEQPFTVDWDTIKALQFWRVL
jgi:hypothetical protein